MNAPANDIIEINISRMPATVERVGGVDVHSPGPAEYVGTVRLYQTEGGFGIYARDALPHGDNDFWQVRGFLAAAPGEGAWRLAAKATAWAAAEQEKRS